MQLGLSSYTYTWAVGVPGYPPDNPCTALDLLERAASLDVGVLQIADNLPLDRLSHRETAALGDRAAELNIQIEVGTRGIDPTHLRRYLDLAERFRSPILRVVVDTADHHPSEVEIANSLQAIVPAFERAGVVLAIENHDRFRSRAFVNILEQVNSDHVGICLDTVNSFGALEGPEVVVHLLAPWVVNLHVKDFDIFRADHMMGFTIEGRPAGQGRLNIPWLLERLAPRDRDLSAILELWTPPAPTLPETIEKEAAWAVESVQHLRQFIRK
jgi:sugar phosphate isomerase/epimerase